jgi:hypothetical protein
MVRRGTRSWGQGRTISAAVILVLIPSVLAIVIAPILPDVELRKAVYTSALTLFFGGLLGGMVKVLLDELASVKRTREDAATFVANVLADLKSVYDRVARAKILIPAHQSVKTYGDEMRDLIEARVQLRNVTRALERRAEGMDEDARMRITKLIRQMEGYLETLTSEFRENYKQLSDSQRAYEELTKVIVHRFAESTDEGRAVPVFPNFVWDKIASLEKASDFMQAAKVYKVEFETPLDDASELLRNELARILRHR